ncbi:MAG: VanZ family protein [Bacilli bacterium]|nr:VanZ family protein [Bacilli bacterium]
MKIKKVISWILVLIWLIVIFFFSAMDSDNSNQKSKQVINTVVETTINTTNDLGIVKEPSDAKRNEIVVTLNMPLRKCMHALVYFILSLLLLNALHLSRFKNYKLYLICVIVCIIYSLFDEYHQTFVNGRTGQLLDALIDTLGSIIGLIVYYFSKKVKR